MGKLQLIVSFLLILCVTVGAQAQPSGDELPEGYYVVIGAFGAGKEDYARRFIQNVKVADYHGEYGFNKRKNLFFTYIDFSPNFQEALASMRMVRNTSSYTDAWVFVCHPGDLSGSLPIAEQPSPAANQMEPASTEPTHDSSSKEQIASKEEKHKPAITIPELEDKTKPGEAVEMQGKQVAILLTNARNDAEVNGEIQYIDTERARLIEVLPSDEVVLLSDPDNGTGKITLLCDIFGFRKEQKDLDYNDLKNNEDVREVSDYMAIFFDLVRYHKGDIATMYNVYFFNDAAVMRPESKYEVNSLLEMMKENPEYRIKIHGHTNSRRPGKIISRGKSPQFFALDEGNKEGMGSAKTLSRERAAVIRDYLISEGIDKKRMEVKAWGGRRMLYDKNSPQAKKNVRVEIEILEK